MPFRVEIVSGILYGKRSKVTFDRDETDDDRDSDGSVPVASARLEGIAEIRYIRGQHSALPNIPAVYDDIFKFLRGDTMRLSTTHHGALYGNLGIGAGEKSVVSAIDESEDTGDRFSTAARWRIDEPRKEEWEWLEGELENGRLPQFERARLL